MKVLYVSTLSSPSLIDKLAKESQCNPGYAVQKFNRMVASGLIKNGVELQTLSAIPVVSSTSRKKRWIIKNETVDGILYHYIPFFNFTGVRQICLFFYSFFYTFFWGIVRRKDKYIICDVLNISVCLGSVWASKFIGLQSVGIMTDMPGLMVNSPSSSDKHSLVWNLVTRVNKSYLSSFSYYVFLTEYMNEVVNKKHRPYIIMEGLVDETMKDWGSNVITEKESNRIVLYAGGLHERYGLKLLLEAFVQLDMNDIELWLFGDGPFVERIHEFERIDSRVHYMGIRPNKEIVDAEIKAALLVNPRPSNEEFTKYSFPSKNMEYMVSGTPLLTTKLPGMPSEYLPYVFLFEEETVEGYFHALQNVLSLTEDELLYKGLNAKSWILNNKNNIVQARRIKELLQGTR